MMYFFRSWKLIDKYVPSDKKKNHLIIYDIYLKMFLNVQLHVKVAVCSYYPFKFYLFSVTVHCWLLCDIDRRLDCELYS